MPAQLEQGQKSLQQQITSETNPLQEALRCASSQPVLFPEKTVAHAFRREGFRGNERKSSSRNAELRENEGENPCHA
jgi:hypothetical protein